MNINKKNGQSGAALIEFVLVVPLLLLFLFGIIEFSIILYNKAIVTNASREAAREWIVYRDNVAQPKLSADQIETIVLNYTGDLLISFGGTGINVTPDPTTVSGPIPFDSGDPLTVTVEYEYQFLLLPGLVQNLLPTLTLQAVTVMRAE